MRHGIDATIGNALAERGLPWDVEVSGPMGDMRMRIVVPGERARTPGECAAWLGLTYECMNCGVVRTYGPAEWVSCEDELGRSCVRRAS